LDNKRRCDLRVNEYTAYNKGDRKDPFFRWPRSLTPRVFCSNMFEARGNKL